MKPTPMTTATARLAFRKAKPEQYPMTDRKQKMREEEYRDDEKDEQAC
jgi:hypothetical protein